jgi:hypothetical protein
MHAMLEVKKQNRTVIKQKAKSFVIAFCGLMVRQWCQTTDTFDDTGGSSTDNDEGNFVFWCTSPGGYGLMHGKVTTTDTNYMESDRLGVVIGSGTATVAPNDSALGTQIRSGEKTGTIFYHGTGVHGITVDAGTDTGSFKVVGIFQNLSGASIDVKEVGLYATGEQEPSVHPNIFNFCILRDTITTVSVADGEFLEVEYTISIAT